MSRRWSWQCVAVAVMMAAVPATLRAQAVAVDPAAVGADSTATVPRDPAVRPGEARIRAGEADRVRLKETLQRMGRREVEGEHRWERRKVGKVALFSSAILPGLGQVYNGRRIKVAVMVGVASGYAAQIWLNHKAGQRARSLRDRLDPGTSRFNLQNRLSEFYEDETRIWGWWTGAIWIIGILDAWTDAHLYDIRAYTPPAEGGLSGPSTRPPAGGRTSYLTLTLEF